MCCEFSESNAIKAKEWTSKHVPAWQDFDVVSSAELLGFFVGPTCAASNWLKPINKYRKRLHNIKKAGVGLALNMLDLNRRILPVLSYVAQLFPLPPTFQYMQRTALHTVYKAPFNMFSHPAFFKVGCIDLPVPRCAIAASAAALVRTALKTISSCRRWIPPMRQVAQENLPVCNLQEISFEKDAVAASASPPWWDSPAYAEILEAAARFSFTHKKLNHSS